MKNVHIQELEIWQMNGLNLTNIKLLHYFCLKHSKIGQIFMKGGPFICSHPVLLEQLHKKFEKNQTKIKRGY